MCSFIGYSSRTSSSKAFTCSHAVLSTPLRMHREGIFTTAFEPYTYSILAYPRENLFCFFISR